MNNSFWKAGHAPTLFAAFLYFDLSFMVWYVLGPLGVQIAGDLQLSTQQRAMMVATPILAGAVLRFLLGLLADRWSPKSAGILAQVIVIAALAAAWLPGLIGGESLASYCLTEPDAGSDAARLRTRARREGDEYVLDGSKCFISGAGSTQVLIVMARTGEDGARGISCFLVPADAPGIRYGRNEDKMGWRAQPTRTITFEGVRIPAGNRIGPEGQGFVYAMKGLDGGRLNIASCSLGAAQAALEQSMRYVEEREQFGKPLATFQALQFKLADMLTELTASRQMVRLGAHRLDRGDAEATLYCAMAKRFATDRCFDVCNEALQLHGGYGYLNDYPLERWVRDTRVHQILEGTNEIMRVIVARRLLEQGGMLDRLL
ncbi:acyl-CoA dehydrogenase family protein [Pseudomonas aeruginosa]|nr:acyl-CoA dehydrogenase family protein [Pseudomonas aeruginosa]